MRNLVFSAGKVLLLAVPLFTSASALGLAWTWVLASLASMLVSVWLLRGLKRGYRVSASGTRVLLAPVLRRSFGHHLVSVGNLAPGYLLPLIVAGMLSATQSAYFFTTWRVGGVFFIISAAVGTSLFADASRAGRNLAVAVRSSVKLIALLLVPAIVFSRSRASRSWASSATSTPSTATPASHHGARRVARRGHERLRRRAPRPAPPALRGRPHDRHGDRGGVRALLVGPYGIAGAGAGWLIAQSLGAVVVGADVLWQRRAVARVRVRAAPTPAGD